MYTITRQHQWPDGDKVVEISAGGIDYTNPDALSARYPGEFEEFLDPREAVETAIKIAQAWQKDTDDEIGIAHGSTGGMTMPFSGEPLTEEVFTGLRDWALKEWNEMPKCDRCGDPLPAERERYGNELTIDFGEYPFCSENCADNAYWEWEKENAEEEEINA